MLESLDEITNVETSAWESNKLMHSFGRDPDRFEPMIVLFLQIDELFKSFSDRYKSSSMAFLWDMSVSTHSS